MKKVWAYDIETLINCFTVSFVDADLKETRTFVIWKEQNDIKDLYDFLETEVKGLVSFNGMNFDRPVLGAVLNWHNVADGWMIATRAYSIAQSIINDLPEGTSVHPVLGKIPELDLYLLYHFNNEARRTSLKWIQCHLGVKNIQEMPHPHDKPVMWQKEVVQILEYNVNDAYTTMKFYNHPKTKSLVSLRKWAKANHGIQNMNISNAHMGEQIVLSKMGYIPRPDTSPRIVHIKDVILPIIKFESDQFKTILTTFKRMKIKTGEENPKMTLSTTFQGMSYDFGLGGLHAVRPNKRYDETIDSIDVKSFYPNIAIRNRLKPAHLDDSFLEVYEGLYNDRIAAKDPVVNNGLKEALNSVFGKSNSIYSPLYDPAFTFAITVNGQLLMAMLAERLSLQKAAYVIMVNTDGMEVIVKDRAKFTEILNGWIAETKMTISNSTYTKLMIRDVNNYIGVTFNSKVKAKGAYEVEKDWNKDPSAKICALAITEHMLYGTDIRETIDKYLTIPALGQSVFHMFKRAKTGIFEGISANGLINIEVPKTIRYLATEIGFVLYQKTDSMNSKVHNDAYITLINDLGGMQDGYVIDRQWYIKETNKLLIEETSTLF